MYTLYSDRSNPMKFLNWAQVSRTWSCKHKEWTIGITVTIVVLIVFHLIWRGGLGFGPGELVTGTIEREFRDSQGKPAKDAQGNLIKETQEITIHIPAKSTWDLLSLIGVPSALVILGYGLQQQQQKQAEAADKKRREIAADEAREEVIQTYFDRLSALLVNENLLAIATKIYGPFVDKSGILSQERATLRERELFNAAVDVIRARTLSILRRFEDDRDRKSSVIRFLIDAEVISKAKLSLRMANLSKADLRVARLLGADLRGADLYMANLSKADLRIAQLLGANLCKAELFDTDLRRANLSKAKLSKADLRMAQLLGADLKGADLHEAKLLKADLMRADLSEATLAKATLPEANLSEADLSGADLRAVHLFKAYLLKTILFKVDLSETNLSGANLYKADLAKANLYKANLYKANLKDANLKDANLNGANLNGAKGLTQSNLIEAKLCRTTFPDGITLEAE